VRRHHTDFTRPGWANFLPISTDAAPQVRLGEGVALEKSTVEVTWVPIRSLFASPSNPRINEPGIPHVAASIRRFGWRQPIVAKRTGEVIEYSEEAVGFGIHYQLRDEVSFEFARLLLWLTDVLVSKRLTEAGGCCGLQIAGQEMACASSTAKERVENTARNLSEAWSQRVREWQRRSQTLIGRENATRKRRARMVLPGKAHSVVIHNHYVPAVSNKPWADKNGNVTEYSRGLDGRVRSKVVGYTQWGGFDYLYSAKLEEQFSAIEGDAKTPTNKLLKGLPFSGPNEKDWIAFLVIQVLRTPRFIMDMMNGLSHTIAKNESDYPTSPGALKAAYETLFSNSEHYTALHRAIEKKTWWVASAPDGCAFIKSDEPAIRIGEISRPDSSLLLPIGQKKCFVADG
jgi:hypothetical protein